MEIFPKSHQRQTGFPTDSVSHLALASEPGPDVSLNTTAGTHDLVWDPSPRDDKDD